MRHLIRLSALICAASLIAAIAYSAEKEAGVVITTEDIRADYEVLGIVHARHMKDVDGVNGELARKAAALGADFLIGTHYFEYQSQLHGAGTAVKVKKAEKEGEAARQ